MFLSKWGKWAKPAAQRSQEAARAAKLSPSDALAAALDPGSELGRRGLEFLDGAADLAWAKGITGEHLALLCFVFFVFFCFCARRTYSC